MYNHPYIIEASLIIPYNNKKQVLLQHKDAEAPSNPNSWCLFGGGIEGGETPEQALEREMKEELEWSIVGYEFFLSNESSGVRRYAFTVLTDFSDGHFRDVLREGDDARFFFRKELANISIVEQHRLLLEYFFEKT